MRLAIIRRYRGKGSPPAPMMEPEGGHASRHNRQISGKKGRPPAPMMGSQRAARWHAKSSNSRFAAACVRDHDLPPQERRLGPSCCIGRSWSKGNIARRRHVMDFRHEINLLDAPHEIVVFCRHLPPLHWSLGPICGIGDFVGKIKSPPVPS